MSWKVCNTIGFRSYIFWDCDSILRTVRRDSVSWNIKWSGDTVKEDIIWVYCKAPFM